MGIEFGRLLSFVLGLGDMCLYALCLSLSGLGQLFCQVWYQLLSMVSIAFNYGIAYGKLNYGIAFNYGKYQSR